MESVVRIYFSELDPEPSERKSPSAVSDTGSNWELFVLDSSNWVLEAGAFAASRAMLLCCRRCSSPFIYLTRASLDRPRSLEMLELEARSPLPGRLLTLDVRSSVVG